MMGEAIWFPGITLADLEKKAILKALKFYNNNKTHTANSLGISIRTLQYKLNEYNGKEQTDETRKQVD